MTVKRELNVTEEDLDAIFSNMKKIEDVLFEEPMKYMKIGTLGSDTGNLHTMDLYTNAIVNRALSLSKGFTTLANTNNYIAAVPLIRLQVDNCLRFYDAMLVDDYNDFFLKYLSGEHIRNLVDIDGKKMTDNYLAKKLDVLFPGVYILYKNTSGYVHFSNEHSFLQNKTQDNDGERMKMTTLIGRDADHFSIDHKVDFAFNMFKSTEFLYKLVRTWKYQKLKVETEMNSDESE